MSEPGDGVSGPGRAYVDHRLGDLLDLVGARSAAPGGGAVAAVATSLAAGLAMMVGRYSTGTVPEAGALVSDLEDLRRRSDALADQDAAAYAAYVGALAGVGRQGQPDPGQVASALRRATAVPLEIAEIAALVTQKAAALLVGGHREVRGDALTALMLAEAATRSAACLVEINVALTEDGQDLLDRASAAVAKAQAAVAR